MTPQFQYPKQEPRVWREYGRVRIVTLQDGRVVIVKDGRIVADVT